MVISGTPDQLQPLIKSKENGLFSRFIIYNFDEISEFKNVFAKKTRDNKLVFKAMGDEIFELYGKLAHLSQPIEFSFTEAQQQKFLGRIRPIRNDIIQTHSEGFVSNLHRHALILFRIAMILTAIRNRGKLPTLERIECSNTDFMLAMRLTQTLLRHSQYTYNTIDNGGLSMQDDELLPELGDRFTTERAYLVGEKHGIPKRTMFDKLQQWMKKRIIKRKSRGNYITV